MSKPTNTDYLIESVAMYEKVFGLEGKSKGLGLGERVGQYVTLHNKDNIQLPPSADLLFFTRDDGKRK